MMASIVKISEAASLGFHALIVLAKDPGRTFSAGEINKILGVSEAHLSKVMAQLSKVGLVHATRGPCGGFVLGKPAHDISLLDIYQAIEGPLSEVTCLLAKPVCKNEKCLLGDLIRSVNHQVAQHLANTKLSSQQV